MPDFESFLRQYDYDLPESYIALSPAHPRDSAKLVVFDRATGATQWTTFDQIGAFLPENALLVLNETKVLPARLPVTRKTGGRIALLCLGWKDGMLHALSPKPLKEKETLTIAKNVTVAVEERADDGWLFTPSFDQSAYEEILLTHGSTPLPPYLSHSPLNEAKRRSEYQTIFAKTGGSVAAPTASLHFTKALLASLEKQGIDIAYVTLHVGLGTFAPLKEEQWQKKTLHKEWFEIPDEAKQKIEDAKKRNRPIIAVGTTVVRTLESACDTGGHVVKPNGESSLFITNEHTFRGVDGLLTNFHVPKSTPLVLTSAFAGRENILNIYEQAKEKNFRFLSFGDAMLIL